MAYREKNPQRNKQIKSRLKKTAEVKEPVSVYLNFLVYVVRELVRFSQQMFSLFQDLLGFLLHFTDRRAFSLQKRRKTHRRPDDLFTMSLLTGASSHSS